MTFTLCLSLGCNSLCLIDGFRQCFGLIDTNCCNFYQEGVCVDECSDRRVTVSNTNFTCVCNNSFTGVNCDSKKFVLIWTSHSLLHA